MGRTKIRANCKQATVCIISLFTVCFIVCQQAQANNSKVALDYYQSVIRGTVTDTTGKPLGGVSIKIEGKKIGALTSQDGHFQIEANTGDVLVFDYIGYTEQRFTVSGTNISVQLHETSSGLNDVVVVGYGTQKRVDLTGAVATISEKEIENRPITNLSSSFAGLVPGAYIHQSSGVPGSDGASIQIRGNASLSSTSPLVLIDGIIGSLNSVNPQDVASVTFLKDAASAAIYGAQGGAGVILVTTKKGGNRAPRISFTGFLSSAKPARVFSLVSNSVQWMQLLNEGDFNTSGTGAFQFDSTTIATWANAAAHPNDTTALGIPNYVAYPNTNWVKFFKSDKVQNYNVSVSGGNENTSYLLSLGYMNDPGFVNNSGYTKYSFRANVETKVGKYITVGTQTYGSLGSYGLFNNTNVLNFLTQTTPTTYPLYKGMYGYTSLAGDKNQNLYNFSLSEVGSKPETYINTTWYGKVNLLKGLLFNTRFNYTTDFVETNGRSNALPAWNFLTMQEISPATPASQLTTYSSYSKTWSYTLESTLNYNTTIQNKHNISAFIGFNQNYNQSYGLSAQGYGLIDPSLTAISTASSFPVNPSGSATDYAFRSVFGRFNYNYLEKYLLEVNVRNDGSSRFGTNYKYGTFPSVSAGWNMAKESFLSILNDHNIQELKLRASWGRTGNSTFYDADGNAQNYVWQALYGQTPYAFNGTAYPGLDLSNLANLELHWETVQQTNIGFDIAALHNLTVSADWFRKKTFGILFQPAIDITHGNASAPYGNFAQVGQNGVELDLGWHDKIGDFNYAIAGNISYQYGNRVLEYKGSLVAGWTVANGDSVYNTNIGAVSSNSASNTQTIQGHMIGEYYLQTLYHGNGTFVAGGTATPTNGPKTGMIRTPDDLAWAQAMLNAGYKFQQSSTVTPGTLYYGDFIYADNNGDGTYGGTNDRKFMNVNSTPRYTFGLTFNASWKNFDFSMIWGGAAGFKYLWIPGTYVNPGYAIYSKIADNHYFYNYLNPSDPKNNINGYYPRLLYSQNNIDNVASDFWLHNATYLKLRNLQIGYTIPAEKMGITKYIKGLRLFFSGENLLTITSYPGADPEEGAGTYYPLLRQYSFGVNANF